MSIRSQITRLENAKAEILTAIIEKGVAVPNSVLLDEVADLIKQITDMYLTSELDGDATNMHLSIELDGETISETEIEHYLSVNFN